MAVFGQSVDKRRFSMINGAQERTRVPFTFKDIGREDRKKIVSACDSESENAAAAGPRNGASDDCKAERLSQDDTASLAARHPIIALHWGFAA